MVSLDLTPEGTYGDVELSWIENEPPGLFTTSQDSVWGAMRKLVCDPLQDLADQLEQFYANLDPHTVDADDMNEWEELLGLPPGSTASLEQRRAAVLSRFQRGPFTRTRRRLIVESFIVATFGQAISFDPTGIPFVSGGTPMYSGATSLAGTYNIVENIPAFSYDVRILNTITVDTVGLTRELTRLTPGGISFTITSTATP